ncbi:MAG TPA: hypothetical protein PLS69_06745 [Terricaulis sp.]|nr:hypothetical protein [Terricaulis sp.]HRP11129.1 hypothetical protein [Terricaulis sp.]
MSDLIIAKAIEFALSETLSATYHRVMGSRVQRAREILIEELRTAQIDVGEAAKDDETVGMMISFAEAVRHNAAFRNLRLIAQVLANKAVTPDARKDDFAMWADMIAMLLPEEVIVLATIQRHAETEGAKNMPIDRTHKAILAATRSDLVGNKKLCASEEELQAIGSALLRTGCLIPVVLDGTGMTFSPSYKMKELAKMARMQEAADEILVEFGLIKK